MWYVLLVTIFLQTPQGKTTFETYQMEFHNLKSCVEAEVAVEKKFDNVTALCKQQA